MHTAKILVVGRTANDSSQLARRLKAWGGECLFASSYEHVNILLGQHAFDLVISEMRMKDGPAFRLIPLFEGSRTSLFCSFPIEDSYLWLPVVDRGKVCLGAPALRPREFGDVLRLALNKVPSVADVARMTPKKAVGLRALAKTA